MDGWVDVYCWLVSVNSFLYNCYDEPASQAMDTSQNYT